MIKDHILTILIALPICGGILTLLIPRKAEWATRWFSLIIGLTTLGFAIPLFFWFDAKTAAMQFQEFLPWIKLMPHEYSGETRYIVNYHLGIDGISLFLVLLTAFLTPVSMLVSWKSITEKTKVFYFSVLLLEGSLIGVFVSLDLILFYLFWDLVLIPMYFVIGIWGCERRVYASIKFFLYTFLGSLLMLASIIYLGVTNPGGVTFDLLELSSASIARGTQIWLFLAFGLAFAVKVPVFPFHTWLPDAHTEAPTAGSVILAGILLKMGAYGFLRFCLPLFPEASVIFGPYIAVLGVIGIIYGALVAFAQPDMKRLVAYSSVSHMGFVMLGMFAFTVEGLQGALIVMIAHGLSTGALFLIVGMLHERRHTRMMSDYGGAWRVVPVLGGFFILACFASLGLPGLSNFPGEFLVILGAFIGRSWVFAWLAAMGVVFAAAYVLRLFGNVMQGPTENPEVKQMQDLNLREIVLIAPVIIFIILLGVFPQALLSKSEKSVEEIALKIRQVRIADSVTPSSLASVEAVRKDASK